MYDFIVKGNNFNKHLLDCSSMFPVKNWIHPLTITFFIIKKATVLVLVE